MQPGSQQRPESAVIRQGLWVLGTCTGDPHTYASAKSQTRFIPALLPSYQEELATLSVRRENTPSSNQGVWGPLARERTPGVWTQATGMPGASQPASEMLVEWIGECPPDICAHVLSPGTCDCGLLWKKYLWGCDEVKDLEMRSSWI